MLAKHRVQKSLLSYLRNRLSDFGWIWHDDAYCPCDVAFRQNSLTSCQPREDRLYRGVWSLPREVLLASWYAVVVTVRPSVCCTPVLYRNDWMNRAVLPWRLSSTYPTLCGKKIRVFPKIRALPSWTLSQTQLRKFRHDKSSALSTKLVNSRPSWLYTDSG